MSSKAELTVEGRRLAVSNLDKVLYPKTGFTKGDLIDYYIRIAPVLLPHLRDRPLTMKPEINGLIRSSVSQINGCTAPIAVHRPVWSGG